MTNTEPSARARDDVPRAETSEHASDQVAWSGQVEDQARRVLASGGPDADTAVAIREALARLEADRTNGESPYESTMHLQQVLDRDELRRG